MRHVRHLFLATLTVLAYDDVSEEMLMPGLEDEGERERMRRRGVRGREIMENLRSAAGTLMSPSGSAPRGTAARFRTQS